MNERRIARIEKQIKERIATLLIHDVTDPRLGFVTICRVEVDKELHLCKVFWSSLGNDRQRRLSGQALDHASGFFRTEVAKILHTRTVPKIRFVYDESVVGAQRMQDLLADLKRARGEEESDPFAPEDPRAAPPAAEQPEPDPGD
jgi:ribosome-binding factor A